MKKIGLCGTGKMGKAIGARLIEKEYNLSIWNRTKSNSDDLIKSGGQFFKKVSSRYRCRGSLWKNYSKKIFKSFKIWFY